MDIQNLAAIVIGSGSSLGETTTKFSDIGRIAAPWICVNFAGILGGGNGMLAGTVFPARFGRGAGGDGDFCDAYY